MNIYDVLMFHQVPSHQVYILALCGYCQWWKYRFGG